jgi:uncharacterized protein YggE
MRSLLGLLSLFAITSTAFAQPSINTSGESIVYVKPDEAIINFGVEILHKELDQAVAQNDEASARLVKAIKGLGIEPQHLQTDHLEVHIRYTSNNLAIEGYTTRRGYSITLKDIGKLETLVQTGLKNGANTLMGVEFRTTELRKYRDQARKMAIKAAKEKAVALAEELDCRVLAPRSIQEGVAYSGYYGGWWGWRGGNAMAQNSVQSAPGGGGGVEGETMPLGQIAVRASVGVTFDLDLHAPKAAPQQ